MMNSEQAQNNTPTSRSSASSPKRAASGERKPSKNFHSMIFPQRLMAILADEENHEALSWLPDGRSFSIRDFDLFVETAMPQFCPKKCKFSSFVRKLSRWGFTLIHKGDHAGAYHHELFLRDKPQLAAQMFYQRQRTMHDMAPATNTIGQSSNSLASSSSSMGSCSTVSLSSRPPLSSMPSRSKMAIKALSMSNVNERSSLPLNGNASASDTQQAMNERADAGSRSSRGTGTLDAFEIQKALLAACGVDPSGMTRPPPKEDQEGAASINQEGNSMMRMGQPPQPGMLMINQQAMEESQRLRSLLNLGARKQLQKMMSSPNLGASNSNLMAVMIHQQQQQQRMSSPSLFLEETSTSR